MKKKISNYLNDIIIIIGYIIFGGLQVQITNCVIETNSQYFVFKELVVLGTYTFFCSIIMNFVKFLLRLKTNRMTYLNPIYTSIIYSLASIITMYIVLNSREIEQYLIYALIIFNTIVNITIMILKRNLLEELSQEYMEYKNRLNLTKKVFNATLLGIILSAVGTSLFSIIIILFMNNDNNIKDEFEFNLFVSIILSVLLMLIYSAIFNKINDALYIRSRYTTNKNDLKRHWLLPNIASTTFIVCSSILYFVVLLNGTKLDVYFSIFISLIVYIFYNFKIEFEDKPGDPYSSNSNWRENCKDTKKDWGFSTTTFYDNKGNYGGQATTYNVGGIEHTMVRDAQGKISGTGTSFEVGGTRHSTYKKQ